jgi:hypothetical protein
MAKWAKIFTAVAAVVTAVVELVDHFNEEK